MVIAEGDAGQYEALLPKKSWSDLVIDPSKEKVDVSLTRLKSTFPGSTGVDAAILLSGRPKSLECCIGILALNDTLVTCPKPVESPSWLLNAVVSKNLTIVAAGFPHRDEVQGMLDLVDQKDFHLPRKVYTCESANQFFEDHHDDPHFWHKKRVFPID